MQLFHHKEFGIQVRSPDDVKMCIWYNCKYFGSFRILIFDDKNKVQADYNPICELHVIPAILEAFADPSF